MLLRRVLHFYVLHLNALTGGDISKCCLRLVNTKQAEQTVRLWAYQYNQSTKERLLISNQVSFTRLMGIRFHPCVRTIIITPLRALWDIRLQWALSIAVGPWQHVGPHPNAGSSVPALVSQFCVRIGHIISQNSSVIYGSVIPPWRQSRSWTFTASSTRSHGRHLGSNVIVMRYNTFTSDWPRLDLWPLTPVETATTP